MAFKDWLIKLLGGQPATPTPPQTPPATRGSSSVIRNDGPILEPPPPSGPASVSLSTNMTDLYYSVEGELETISLSGKFGANLRLVDDEIVAIAANDILDTGISSNRGSRKSLSDPIQFPVKSNNQYTITYNPASQSVSLIGALTITGTTSTPGNTLDPDAECDLHTYSLVGQSLNLRRTKANLELRVIEEISNG